MVRSSHTTTIAIVMSTPQTAEAPGAFVEIKSNRSTDRMVALFFLLEECVNCCQDLADAMAPDFTHLPLHRQVTECISACRNYQAAASRESESARILAVSCRTACATLAKLCAEHASDLTERCQQACEACLQVIRYRRPKVPWR